MGHLFAEERIFFSFPAEKLGLIKMDSFSVSKKFAKFLRLSALKKFEITQKEVRNFRHF